MHAKRANKCLCMGANAFLPFLPMEFDSDVKCKSAKRGTVDAVGNIPNFSHKTF